MQVSVTRRFSVWVTEMALVLLLLAAVTLAVAGDSKQWSRGDDFLLALVWTAFVFMVGSGYLITTGLLAVFFRSRSPWLYPTLAALLFVVHDQLFYTGWTVPDLSHVQLQIAGACIVFACTFVGTWILRRWAQSTGSPSSA